MKQIELDLSEDFSFYCPVTGEKMIGDLEPFEPSEATVFCFLESFDSFEYATEAIKLKYSEAKEKFKRKRKQSEKEKSNLKNKVDPPTHSISENANLEEQMIQALLSNSTEESIMFETPFSIMLKDLANDIDAENYVCFSITNSGIACGPMSSTVHFCVDFGFATENK